MSAVSKFLNSSSSSASVGKHSSDVSYVDLAIKHGLTYRTIATYHDLVEKLKVMEEKNRGLSEFREATESDMIRLKISLQKVGNVSFDKFLQSFDKMSFNNHDLKNLMFMDRTKVCYAHMHPIKLFCYADCQQKGMDFECDLEEYARYITAFEMIHTTKKHVADGIYIFGKISFDFSKVVRLFPKEKQNMTYDAYRAIVASFFHYWKKVPFPSSVMDKLITAEMVARFLKGTVSVFFPATYYDGEVEVPVDDSKRAHDISVLTFFENIDMFLKTSCSTNAAALELAREYRSRSFYADKSLFKSGSLFMKYKESYMAMDSLVEKHSKIASFIINKIQNKKVTLFYIGVAHDTSVFDKNLGLCTFLQAFKENTSVNKIVLFDYFPGENAENKDQRPEELKYFNFDGTKYYVHNINLAALQVGTFLDFIHKECAGSIPFIVSDAYIEVKNVNATNSVHRSLHSATSSINKIVKCFIPDVKLCGFNIVAHGREHNQEMFPFIPANSPWKIGEEKNHQVDFISPLYHRHYFYPDVPELAYYVKRSVAQETETVITLWVNKGKDYAYRKDVPVRMCVPKDGSVIVGDDVFSVYENYDLLKEYFPNLVRPAAPPVFEELTIIVDDEEPEIDDGYESGDDGEKDGKKEEIKEFKKINGPVVNADLSEYLQWEAENSQWSIDNIKQVPAKYLEKVSLHTHFLEKFKIVGVMNPIEYFKQLLEEKALEEQDDF